MVEHGVVVQGIEAPGMGTAPTILQRTDQEFLDAVLDDLGQTDGLGNLAATEAHARDNGGVLKLYQPVQRTFHLALVEVACDTFGYPRLDPDRIVSAGLVIRRVGLDANGQPTVDQVEGWRTLSRSIQGWVPFNQDQDLDPDPQQRRPLLEAGLPELDRRLALLPSIASVVLSESASPLFVAPPDVCEATGRTILYGVVPVTSSELSEAPDTSSLPSDFVQSHLASYLRAAPSSKPIPFAGTTVNTQSADTTGVQYLDDYLSFLRQLLFELDAFGDSTASQTLFAALNAITVTYADGSTGGAGDALSAQADALINQTSGSSAMMPVAWPAVTDDQANAILNAAKVILDARLALVRPQEGRYSVSSRQYRLRAFVRVRSEEADCPANTWWSPYSEPFTIAPWYDGSGVPPVQITLPDASDRDFLKSLKPNVSFVVPPKLFDMLQKTKLKGLMDGSAPPSNGTIEWICGFNIPIITLCAFIVLNIFLQLLDIVFFWIILIKICIPFPRKA